MICQAGGVQEARRRGAISSQSPGRMGSPPRAYAKLRLKLSNPSIIHHPASSALSTLAVQPFFFLCSCLAFHLSGIFLFEFISSLLADNMIGHGATGVLGEGQFGFQPRKWDQVQDSTNANCRWNSR